MVTRESLSSCSNSIAEEDGQDTASVATTNSDSSSHGGELVLAEDSHRDRPSFGNIAVTNSTDIHFGNKTYYQGPVTIKQFLYANPQVVEGETPTENGKLAIKNDSVILNSVPDCVVGNDNPNFVSDNVVDDRTKNDIDRKIHSADSQPPQVAKGARWLRNCSRQQLLVVIPLGAVLLVSLITLMTVLLTRHPPASNSVSMNKPPMDTDEQQSGSPAVYPVDPDVPFTLPQKLKIVTRREWLAQPASDEITPLQLPVPYVIIMHTATENCSDQATCTFHVRFIQSFHIDSRNWSDIGYNFLVGGDGYAYEGRGWKGQGAHTYGYNSKSIGIAFIGTFNTIMPPKRQIVAAKQLIDIGLERGYIAKDYKLLAARQLQTTQSPGLLLYEDVKKWPHWADKP